MALEFEGFEAPISAIEDVKANGVREDRAFRFSQQSVK